MIARRFGTLFVSMFCACGGDPTPAASPRPPASPLTSAASSDNDASAPLSSTVPAASGAAPATPSATAAPAPTTTAVVASGPVRSAEDAIARALPAADAALRAAYAKSKSHALGGPHPQPFVTAAEARATPSGTSYVVKWSRHPPAGFEIEATVSVSSAGAVTVTKAEATFSPD